jgi:hypothetical protein
MKKDPKPSKAKTKFQKVLPQRDERPASVASRKLPLQDPIVK